MSIFESFGVFIGHRIGAAILFCSPRRRRGVEWTVR